MRNTARKKKLGEVRASRVPRFGPRVLGIALGVVSMVCSVACKHSVSTSTPKAPQLATSPQTPSTGEVSAGETRAGKQFAAWLTAFNSGERDALVAYHQKYFPYEVASEDVHGIDRELGLSQGTGGFHLKKSESRGPTSIVAILKVSVQGFGNLDHLDRLRVRDRQRSRSGTNRDLR